MCRPVTDLPQSGLFCTREALQSYLFSPVTAVIHAPVQVSQDSIASVSVNTWWSDTIMLPSEHLRGV